MCRVLNVCRVLVVVGACEVLGRDEEAIKCVYCIGSKYIASTWCIGILVCRTGLPAAGGRCIVVSVPRRHSFAQHAIQPFTYFEM